MTENKTTERKATDDLETLKLAGTPRAFDPATPVGSAEETMELSDLEVQAISGGTGALPPEGKKT